MINKIGPKSWSINMQTIMNPYENCKLMIMGEAYAQEVIFEKLPNDSEDEINLNDCIINEQKIVLFNIKNNSPNVIRFYWNTQGTDEFTFFPKTGHIDKKGAKQIKLVFFSTKPNSIKALGMICEVKQITQAKEFIDWDDTKTNIRYVSKTEFEWIKKRREEELQRKKEEDLEKALAMQKKTGTKPVKPPEKKPDKPVAF